MQVLRTIMGEDGLRTYLVLVDDDREIRTAGGLPGAFLGIRAHWGYLSLVRQGARSDVGRYRRPMLLPGPGQRRSETIRVSWRVRSGSQQDRSGGLSVTPSLTFADAVMRIALTCGAV